MSNHRSEFLTRPAASRALTVFLADLISKHLGLYTAEFAIGALTPQVENCYSSQFDHLAYSIYLQVNNSLSQIHCFAYVSPLPLFLGYILNLTKTH